MNGGDEVLVRGQRCTVVHRAGERVVAVRSPSGALAVMVRKADAWHRVGPRLDAGALLSVIASAVRTAAHQGPRRATGEIAASP